jgi:hypothetical protein
VAGVQPAHQASAAVSCTLGVACRAHFDAQV